MRVSWTWTRRGGRITSISSVDASGTVGQTVNYQYDAQGNLIAFTDADNNTTQFTYLPSTGSGQAGQGHYLDTIIDANGVQAARTEYDAQGRVSTVTDAAGNTSTITYDVTGKTQTTTDQLGHPTTTTYDADGNAIRVVNALGGITQSTYDENDHVLTQTTVIGQEDNSQNGEHNDLTTSYTYDAFGDVLSTTNPDGTTTRSTYNTFGQPLTQTDALGNTTYYDYDNNGNLRDVTDPRGNSVHYTYDVHGNVTGEIDANGNTVTNSYDSAGNVTRQTNSLAITGTYSYDSQANVIGSTYDWVNPNNRNDVRPVTTSTGYDVEGRIISSTDAEGHTTTTTYTADGQVASTTAPNGDITQNTYDARGELIETRQESQDSDGNVQWLITRSVYDAAGHETAATDPYLEGNNDPTTGVLKTYDPLGNVLETDSVNGIVIDIVDDGTGLQAVLTAPGTIIAASTTQYDANGREVSSTDQYGLRSLTTYDRVGRVVDSRTQSIDQNGNVVWLVSQTVYNSKGQVELTTNQYQDGSVEPIGATEIIYDSLGNVVRTIRLSAVQVRLFDANTGQTVDPFDPENATIASEITDWGVQLYSTNTVYNDLGQVIQSVSADGQITNYEYDSFGRRTATLGQLVEPASVGITGAPTGSLVRLRTESVYDSYGDVATVRSNVYEYVLANGTTQIDRSRQQETDYQYDQFGNVVKTTYADGSFTLATYDGFGNKLSSTDQRGQTTQYQYDGENRLTAAILPQVPDPNNDGQLTTPTYQYGYDVNGNQTSITDPNGGQTTFTYDPQGNELSRTLPLGQTETFGYDTQGRQTTHTDFQGDVIDSVFSNAGMLDEILYFSPGEDPNTDPPAQTTTYEYDAFGHTGEETDSSGATVNTYNSQGQLTQVSSPEGLLNYVYDDLGRQVETFTSAAAGPTTPIDDFRDTYDTLGRLASVAVDERNGVLLSAPEVTTYEYDLQGNLIEQTAPNGIVTSYNYDSVNRVTSMTDTAPDGSPVDEYDYIYRADGLKSGTTETLWQSGTPDVTVISWTYDALDRLTQEVYNSYDPSLSYTDNYTYDLDGNRVGKEHVTAETTETTTDTYDANDRLISDVTAGTTSENTTTYQYGGSGNPGTEQTQITSTDTATGNVLERENFTYNLQGMTSSVVINKYDASGSLTEQDTVAYTYNSNGDRVGETDEIQDPDPNNPGTLVVQSNSTTTYLVSDDNPTGYSQVVEQLRRDVTSGAVLKDLVFTLGLQITTQASVTPGSGDSGTPSFLFYDAHGSTRLVLDGTLNILGVYVYDAYGNPIGFDPTTAVVQVLYVGQRLNPLTGEYDDRARDYAPWNGTFTTADSYAGNPQSPQSYNKYLYTQGDPTNLFDPSGEASEYNWWTGALAHMLFAAYMATKGVLLPDTPLGLLFPDKFTIGTPAGNATPDAVNITTSKYYELKPITHQGGPNAGWGVRFNQAKDAFQMARYDHLLNPIGISRGKFSDIATNGQLLGAIIGLDGTIYQVRLYAQEDQMEPTGFNGRGIVLYSLTKIAKLPVDWIPITGLAVR
jgi:RHS repeat-associated protein